MSRRQALLNQASPMLMRAAGYAAREAAAASVVGRMIEKRTYELAGKLGPTERPQTQHLQLPRPPKPRFKLVEREEPQPVYLPPTLYHAAERERYDMAGYAILLPIPTS